MASMMEQAQARFREHAGAITKLIRGAEARGELAGGRDGRDVRLVLKLGQYNIKWDKL